MLRAVQACGNHVSFMKQLFYVLTGLIVMLACVSCDEGRKDPADTSDADRVRSSNQPKDSVRTEAADTVASVDTLTTVPSARSIVPDLKGRCINVSLCGIDSRLNTAAGRADANHVLRFWLDEGAVEIVDIPRGTYADVGLDSAFNFIANLRAHKGRSAYLKAISEIAGCTRIDYYCEVGLSQALGILELLGHKDNAQETLRALRTRHAFATGDYQRSFNQGTFLKQTMTRHFAKSTSWFRDPLLRAGMLLVDTDIPIDTVKMIVDALDAKGFPGNGKCYVHIKPTYSYKLPEYDLTSAESISKINKKIDERMKIEGLEHVDVQTDYVRRLVAIVDKASLDTGRRPLAAVTQLRRVFEQRAWMQVDDRQIRKDVFTRICSIMERSYLKAKRTAQAAAIRKYYDDHQKLMTSAAEH